MIVTRLNPIGLTYQLSEDGDKCKVTTQGKSMVMNCPLDEMSQRWYDWQMRGTLIQNAFDNLNTDEREFLLTGMTPEEWNAMFGKGDE